MEGEKKISTGCPTPINIFSKGKIVSKYQYLEPLLSKCVY